MADDKILASVSDLVKAICDLLALAKNPIGFETLKQIAKLVADIKALSADVQAAVPELSGLSLSEDGQILAQVYQGFLDVVAAASK